MPLPNLTDLDSARQVLLRARTALWTVGGAAVLVRSIMQGDEGDLVVAACAAVAILAPLAASDPIRRQRVAVLTDVALYLPLVWVLGDGFLVSFLVLYALAAATLLLGERWGRAVAAIAAFTVAADIVARIGNASGWWSIPAHHVPTGTFELEGMLVVRVVGIALAYLLFRSIARVVAAEVEGRQELHERFERLVAHLPDAVAVHRNGTIVYVNDAAVRLVGAANRTELIGRPMLEFVHPEDRHEVLVRVRAALAGSPQPARQMRFVRLDGSEIWVETRASVVPFQGGPAVQVVVRDVTERVRAEAEERRRSELLHAVISASDVILVHVGADGRIVLVEGAPLATLGIDPERIVGRHATEVTFGNPRLAELAERAIAGAAVRETVEIAGRWFELRYHPATHGTMATIVDVTDRVLAAEALAENELRYRTLFEQSPVALRREDFSAVADALDELRADGIADLERHLADHPEEVVRLAGLIQVVDANPAVVEMLRAESRADLIGPFPVESVTDEVVPSLVAQFMALWNGEDRCAAPLRGRALDGSPLDGMLHWVVARRPDGSLDPAQVVVSITDMSAQRRVQDLTERRAAEFESLYAVAGELSSSLHLDDVLRLVLDESTRLVDGDRSAIFLLDEDRRTVTGVGHVFSAGPDLDIDEFMSGISGWVIRHGVPTLSTDIATDPRNGGTAAETARQSEDRSLVVAPLVVGGRTIGTLSITRGHDREPFTEEDVHLAGLFAAQAALAIHNSRLYERLEDLIDAKDRFVAAVSHELRTPLTAVLGISDELARTWTTMPPQEVGQFLDMLRHQAREVTEIVEDLLVAARADIGKVSVSPSSVAVDAQIRQTMAAAVQPTDLLRIRMELDPVSAWVDPVRFRQVVRNLITNAIRYGGEDIAVRAFRMADRVVVEVSDDGPGIPDELAETIFRPYERVPGNRHRDSIGLGLYIARTLARLMDGDLTYRRSDGRTVFRFSIPVAAHGKVRVPA